MVELQSFGLSGINMTQLCFCLLSNIIYVNNGIRCRPYAEYFSYRSQCLCLRLIVHKKQI